METQTNQPSETIKSIIQHDAPSVYVGTYAKYSNGSIAGAWVRLDQFNNAEEFEAYCIELHKDEEDPEFMLHDFENFPEAFYSESALNDDIWEFLSLDDDDRAMLEAFKDCFGHSEGSIQDARDAYFGQFDSDEDMAWDLLEGTGDLNEIPERLRFYFDVEKYARDLMISDFSESNGYYFNSNW